MDEENNAREEVFRKTVIALLHPETVPLSCSKELSDVVCESSSGYVPATPYDIEGKEGKVYSVCPPPTGYVSLGNTDRERTSKLSASGSEQEDNNEQTGTHRKRHKKYNVSLKRAAVDKDFNDHLKTNILEVKGTTANLTKNQKRKLKKKRQREKHRQTSSQSKEFTYEPDAGVDCKVDK